MILETAKRALVAGAMGATALGAQASGYSFQTIATPSLPAGSYRGMSGMNDNGQILMAVGVLNVSWDFTAANDVYDVATKTFTPLPAVPGADPNSTQALGINDSGQMVGEYHTPGNQWLGYAYSGGVFTTLTPPGGPSVTGWGISNNGQIVGMVTSANFQIAHGFTLVNGTYSLIDAAPSPANSTIAFFDQQRRHGDRRLRSFRPQSSAAVQLHRRRRLDHDAQHAGVPADRGRRGERRRGRRRRR